MDSLDPLGSGLFFTDKNDRIYSSPLSLLETAAAKAVEGRNMNLFVSSKEFFAEAVHEGIKERKLDSLPRATDYLINLLEFYLDARNLHTPKKTHTTLAEMYLTASQSEPVIRYELLKQLGDRALYLTGFFGESLNRKIIDVDYYCEMGGTAYRDLATVSSDQTMSKVYDHLAKKFVHYADVLTYISQKSFVQSNNDVLSLYETYLKTGSEFAKDRLQEMGVSIVPIEQTKKIHQF